MRHFLTHEKGYPESPLVEELNAFRHFGQPLLAEPKPKKKFNAHDIISSKLVRGRDKRDKTNKNSKQSARNAPKSKVVDHISHGYVQLDLEEIRSRIYDKFPAECEEYLLVEDPK